MQVIGIAGKIGVGKSTVASALVRRLPGIWARDSFARALKDEAAKRYEFPRVWADSAKLMPVSTPFGELDVRRVLQMWGEFRRRENPNYWVDVMRRHFLEAERMGVDGIVLDDVRRVNEAELVLENGGKVYYIMPYEGAEVSNHISETELDEFAGFARIFSPAYGELSSVVGEILPLYGAELDAPFRRWASVPAAGYVPEEGDGGGLEVDD